MTSILTTWLKFLQEFYGAAFILRKSHNVCTERVSSCIATASTQIYKRMSIQPAMSPWMIWWIHIALLSGMKYGTRETLVEEHNASSSYAFRVFIVTVPWQCRAVPKANNHTIQVPPFLDFFCRAKVGEQIRGECKGALRPECPGIMLKESIIIVVRVRFGFPTWRPSAGCFSGAVSSPDAHLASTSHCPPEHFNYLSGIRGNSRPSIYSMWPSVLDRRKVWIRTTPRSQPVPDNGNGIPRSISYIS